MLTGLLLLGGRLGAVPPASLLAGERAVAPDGFDVERFLGGACACFRELQQAWDAADRDAIARLALAPACRDLCDQLHRRAGGADARTEVIELKARLMALDEVPGARLARVEFSGRLRDGAAQPAARFRELWWLAQRETPDPGGASRLHAPPPWQVARVLALD